MKKIMFVTIMIVFLIIAGCAKKQEETLNLLPEETTVGVSSQVAEVTSTTSAQNVEKTTAAAAKTIAPVDESQKAVESTITTKPAAREIQQALKNAGYYNGKIDGDIGPMSKQAIKDFQTANNLKADGVIGTLTWSKLKDYLSSPVTTTSENKY